MHQRRQAASNKLPIERKGTKYVVRASSHVNNAVPVLLAVREMLHLAKTTKEAEGMIKRKLLKLNGKLVKDIHQAIKLFDIFEADKLYRLIILQTGKFSFEEAKHKTEKLAKVVSRNLVKGNKIQLNLNDGSNHLTSQKIRVGDSVKLDFSGKIKDHLPMEKGKHCFIISGKYVGLEGKIESVESGKIKVKFSEKKEAVLNQNQVVVI